MASESVEATDDSCHVYEASPGDAPVLHRLILELAAFYHATEQARLSVARLEADLAAGKFWCLLAARSAGEPAVGYALCYRTYSTWEGEGLYIDDLYVQEAQRGRQMGTALVLGCVRRALREGCARLQWQAQDSNARALDFYTRTVGAAERVEASGARYVNLIMRPDAMAAFCARQAALR